VRDLGDSSAKPETDTDAMHTTPVQILIKADHNVLELVQDLRMVGILLSSFDLIHKDLISTPLLVDPSFKILSSNSSQPLKALPDVGLWTVVVIYVFVELSVRD
jgi:hypothetical protein